MQIIPQHNLIPHKIRSRRAVKHLNRNWNDKFHNWFNVLDVHSVYHDLWDNLRFNKHTYNLLSDFHCIKWKYITLEEKEYIAKLILNFLDTSYIGYKHGRFFFIDLEEIKRDEEYKESIRQEEALKLNTPSMWRKLYTKFFGGSIDIN